MPASDLRSELRWLASGFLLMLSSGFGQTYFIALFAEHLKRDIGLSDGLFGTLYMTATLVSAGSLMIAGKLADTLATRWLGVGVLIGLAVTSLGMAINSSIWALGIIIFGLRFFGQGMLIHTAMTAIGRWFNRKRGRAISIAALGMPMFEATIPGLAVASIALIGWRATWVAVAAALVCISMPLLIVLLSRERVPTAVPVAGSGVEVANSRRQWTRGDVMRSGMFYALLPGVLGAPLILTGYFFNQVAILNSKGWDISWLGGGFTILACANVLAALTSGWLIDRIGTVKLLPFFLLPLGVALLMLHGASEPYFLLVFMAVAGLTVGGMNTIQGAVWAELYGVAHLGAIRSLGTAGVVFASAISPALIGVLLDLGVTLPTLLLAMGIYCFAASAWLGVLTPRLIQLARDSAP